MHAGIPSPTTSIPPIHPFVFFFRGVSLAYIPPKPCRITFFPCSFLPRLPLRTSAAPRDRLPTLPAYLIMSWLDGAPPPPRCQEGEGGGQRSIIEVTTDEAVGVALALGRQVYVDEDIWEGGRVSRVETELADGNTRYSPKWCCFVGACVVCTRTGWCGWVTFPPGARGGEGVGDNGCGEPALDRTVQPLL